MYFCHLFLISSAFVRSLLFLLFIEPIFAWNVPLVALIFLRRSVVFPILPFSFITLHCSLKKAFLSLLALLRNSAFIWIDLSLSPLPFASLFSAICKTSLDNHFAFLHLLSPLHQKKKKIPLFIWNSNSVAVLAFFFFPKCGTPCGGRGI